MKLLVSIHDVMPETLARVEAIFDRLVDAELTPVTLLIVPGTGWAADTLDRLRALLARGARPAGHGWTHHAPKVSGPKHRLHSALISRNAAEHLSLDRSEIVALMRRNHHWFSEHDLEPPRLYVPPAWAMGPVARAELDRLPFQRYETLAGIYDSLNGRFHRLPMAGFEADTAFRQLVVGASNGLNRALARACKQPLRLGIHPDDFELRLAKGLQGMLEAGGEVVDYDAPLSSAA
jgi:predicted deacetylase